MADKKAEAAPAPEKGKEEAAPKKKLPIKVIGIVAALMIAEGAAVVVLLGSGSPKASHGETTAAELHDDESEKTSEIELVSDKFQNMTTGQAWVWQVSIFLQVRNKNSERVQAVLEQRNAEIREGLSQIIGRARHTQLSEPEKPTLSRQIASFLEKLDGITVDGKSVVERVIFADCRGFPTSY
jgi:flagellar basal body-associated protein FliL